MRQHLITCVILLIVVLLSAPSSAYDLGLTINSTLVYSGTLENWATSGIQLPNGTYLVAWQHATSESNNDGVAYASTSADFGSTWSAPITLMSNASYAIFEPQFGIFNDTLFFFYDTTDADSSGNPSTRYVLKSPDLGATWETPIAITTGGYIRGSQNPINLTSGRIVLPGFIYNSTSSKYNGVVYYSDDNCTTWSSSGRMVSSQSTTEPAVIQFANQTLMALIRNSSSPGGLYQFKSMSIDNGSTWSEPIATAIRSPRAQSVALKTSTGNFAYLWNNVSSPLNTPRTPLSFSISADEFSTVGNYTAIKSGTGQWSNMGLFTNSSGYIVAPYTDETNWRIYVATMKEPDFFPQIVKSTMPDGGGGGSYSNATQFYVANPPSGQQTNYPIMITLSNQSGISGQYGYLDNTRPNIIIYTDGMTRPDWTDVNVSGSTGFESVPHWAENATQNATCKFLWASVTTGDTYQLYYGAPSQTTPSLGTSIYSTFPYGEDYIVNALNTTQNVLVSSAGGSSTISNGINAIVGGTGDREQVRSIQQFGTGYAVRSYFKASTETGTNSYDVGFGSGGDTNNAIIQLTSIAKYFTAKKTTGTTVSRSDVFTSYGIGEVSRYDAGGSIVNYSVNNVFKTNITTNVPTANINATTSSFPNTITLSVDWVVVRPIVYPEPQTESYVLLEPSVPIVTPVAAFSCSPTSVSIGGSITCADESSNNPDTWYWEFGDGNTSTSQNPTYTYPFVGTFGINFSANNTAGLDWENKTDYITITNVSGFTQQDLWQTGHYTITLNIKDSTNAPIPVVTVTDNFGNSYTTTNGTAFFTEDAGATVFYFASTGYVSKAMSYIVDEDATHTVQLVTAGNTNNPGIVYIPQQVRFQLIGTDGAYLSNVFIQATPINFTAPANWTETLLGISPSVGIRDTTVYGTTASDGSWVAPMLQSFQYQINLTRGTDVNYNFTIYPLSNDYKFTIPVGGYLPIVTPSNIVSYSLQNATINESSTVMYQFINMTYNDGSLNTDKLSFVVYNANNTLVYSRNYTGAASNAQNFSYVQQCNKGQAYTYGFQANQSAYGWINQSSTIKLISQVELLANGPAWITQWFAIAMIVIFGTLFMIFSKAYGLVGIPLLTWSFQYVFGFLPATFLSNVALLCMLTIGVPVYIRQAENKIQ